MIRFFIRRRMLDRGTNLATEGLESLDCEVPELQRVLLGGGLDPHGAYDHRDLAGCEVLCEDALSAAAPDLLAALRIAVLQNSHDMKMTGEELRLCEAAIAKATGA